METVSEETLCTKCTKAKRIAMCYGCQQSFCTRHFIKHRLHLSKHMDDIHEKYEVFRQDLNRDNFQQPLLSSIYAWERESIRKIQEIAEKVRHDLCLWMEQTKNEVNISLNEITLELESNEKSDDYTEIDLQRWTKQLEELQNLLEKSSTISIVQDKKSSSTIHGIKMIEQSSSSISIPETNGNTSQTLIEPIQEHFVSMFGPCKLFEEDHVVTHSCYRAGLSQIRSKNIFIGIHSSSKQISSSIFDYSVHGWWNLDHVIINGESEVGDTDEIIRTDDKITLIIDCDNQQIQLEHHRSKRIVHLPIKLQVCPFPWKILVRLLTTNDCVRILSYVHNT